MRALAAALLLTALPAKALVWPDDAPPGHRANSDPWLIRNHDRITEMRPRILIVNFANGRAKFGGASGGNNVDDGPFSPDDLGEKAARYAEVLSQASTYHGYENPSAKPFLRPVVRVVDLRDSDSDPHRFNANGRLFPHGMEVVAGGGERGVDYYRLLTDARVYGPKWGRREKSRYLSLAELFARGEVHEVVIVANQVDPGASPPEEVTRNILEVASVAQTYDADLAKNPGKFIRYFGPKKDDVSDERSRAQWTSLPWTGVSLRVVFQNASRGVGCTLHGLGHDLEYRFGDSVGAGAAIPSLLPLFRRFADMSLNETMGAPFSSLYTGADPHLGAAHPFSYDDCDDGDRPTCRTLIAQRARGAPLRIADYRPACGNIHYPPGARFGYDYHPEDGVLSSCESFGRRNEKPAPLDLTRWTDEEDPELADCGGDFVRYWFQNLPGYRNPGFDPSTGGRMRNWWPYLYY